MLTLFRMCDIMADDDKTEASARLALAAAAHLQFVTKQQQQDRQHVQQELADLRAVVHAQQQQLEQVLEPFHQLDNARSPDRPGVGLGLSIARACVQAQGGTLTLSNLPQGGLCATVQLPA